MRYSSIPKWQGEAMQLSQLVTDFIRYRAARGAAEKTLENYQRACDNFVSYVTAVEKQLDSVRNFSPEMLEGYVNHCDTDGLKKSSINVKLSALSELGDYGLKAKYRGKYILDENPMKRIERPKAQRPKQRYLLRDEILAMLRVEAAAEDRLALATLFHTTLRATAFCEAKVKNLAIDGETIRLSVIEKGDNPDTFVLPAEIAEPLIESLKLREAGQDDPLFVNPRGAAYTRHTLSETVMRLAKKAGVTRIPVRAHLFARHSTATLAGQNGASVFEIAAMLRHRDTNTAKKYVHGVSAEAVRGKVRSYVLRSAPSGVDALDEESFCDV